MRALTGALVALALSSRVSGAQDGTLAAKLDRPTYQAVVAIIDSARKAKLPTKPLNDKALEGAAKGSDGPKIVVAVRQLSIRMGSAKRVLHPGASSDEIKAAADVLESGVSVRDLARVSTAAGKRPATMPLAVLTDLINRKIPIASATDLVLQLLRSGVKDGDLALFQRNVRADIERGADPTVAATTRARGFVVRAAGTPRLSE